MQVLWAVNPQQADALSTSYFGGAVDSAKRSPEKLREYIADTGVDVDLDQVVEEEVFPGFTTFVDKGRYRRLYDQGFRFIVQGIKDRVVASVCTSGVLGSNERASRGIGSVNETSKEADIASGGSDQALNYLITEAKLGQDFGAGQPFVGSVQAVIHPREIGRLDYFFHPCDGWGTTAPYDTGSASGEWWRDRVTMDKAIELLQTTKKSSTTEAAVRTGIPRQSILRITCSSEQLRTKLINTCTGSGVQDCNGVPIEDFIVVERNMGEVYRKYVEPFLTE